MDFLYLSLIIIPIAYFFNDYIHKKITILNKKINQLNLDYNESQNKINLDYKESQDKINLDYKENREKINQLNLDYKESQNKINLDYKESQDKINQYILNTEKKLKQDYIKSQDTVNQYIINNEYKFNKINQFDINYKEIQDKINQFNQLNLDKIQDKINQLNLKILLEDPFEQFEINNYNLMFINIDIIMILPYKKIILNKIFINDVFFLKIMKMQQLKEIIFLNYDIETFVNNSNTCVNTTNNTKLISLFPFITDNMYLYNNENYIKNIYNSIIENNIKFIFNNCHHNLINVISMLFFQSGKINNIEIINCDYNKNNIPGYEYFN